MYFYALIVQVTVNQYDNPIDCYSEETIEEMTNSSTWKKTDDQVLHNSSKFSVRQTLISFVLSMFSGADSAVRSQQIQP